MEFIVPPTPNGRAVKWAPDLIVARRLGDPIDSMKPGTRIVPRKTAELDDAWQLRFGRLNQRLVLHLEHGQRTHLPPMGHQAKIFAIVEANIAQIVGIVMLTGEMLEIDGQAGIARIAHAMDDARSRKQ